MASSLQLYSHFTFKTISTRTRSNCCPKELGSNGIRCEQIIQNQRAIEVKNGKDSLEICKVVNGLLQKSGGWGKIDRDNDVDAIMLCYADNGFTTFDMANIYGPAEDLYGIFINRVRREGSPELLELDKRMLNLGHMSNNTLVNLGKKKNKLIVGPH